MGNAVTAPEILRKHPDESILYGIDFAELLDSGENLSRVNSVSSATTNSAAGNVTVGSGAINGTEVQFRVSGGDNGGDYRIVATVETSGGNTRVSAGNLEVRSD